MRKILVILILVMNIILFARPAFAAGEYSQKLEFTEQLDNNAQTTYFNPKNSTPLPQKLGLINGVYLGPQFPYAAIKLDVRDFTQLYLNFTVNLTYQDIMNGVWDWDILIPLTGNFTFKMLYVNGVSISSENCYFKVNTTDYGLLYEIWYPLYPGNNTFSFYIETSSSPILYLARENQPASLDIRQSGKQHFDIHVAYAFLFKKGFSQKGMGALEIPANTTLSIYYDGANFTYDGNKVHWLTGPNDSFFASLLLPVYTSAPMSVNVTVVEYHLQHTAIGYVVAYVNGTSTYTTTFNIQLNKKGLNYIYQSNPHPANYTDNPTYCSGTNCSNASYWEVKGIFKFRFPQPVKLLFCTYAPVSANGSIIGFSDWHVKMHDMSLDNMGIVFSLNFSSKQYAKVIHGNGITVYDFGFASVDEFFTGTYVIFPHGNYKEWVIIKNVTVKSIGAKVDDILFGGAFEFSSNNDILSMILGAVKKIWEIAQAVWNFLQHIGEVIWAYLLKFVKFLIDLANWIWDSLGGIFNYLLYLLIPISIMFIISYIARWAKGLKATEEKGAKS